MPNIDPAAMVDALADLYLGLLATFIGPNGRRIDAYLDYLREHMPEALEAGE